MQPWTHMTHHGPDLKEATTFPHIILSALLRGTYIRITLFLGLPRRSPEIVPIWIQNSLFRPPIGMNSEENL
jgi:hypothetical protein